MAVELIIGGTVIDFPSDSQSPDWSPAVIQFAQVVAAQLNSIVGPYDIVPQQMIIDTLPNGSATAITNLDFSTANVAGALISYAVYRTSTSQTVTEYGQLFIDNNPGGMTGSKWLLSREADGDALVDFSISDTGQVSLTPSSIGGTNYSGYISYRASTLQTSYT